MIKCCVLFSLLISTNSTSLFVCCLLACMVGLLDSGLYIMTIFMANLFFILALNCRSREEHCPNKGPFEINYKKTDRKYYEYYELTGEYYEWIDEYYESVNGYYEWVNEYYEYYE